MPEGGEELARQFYGVLLDLREVPKPPVLKARGGVWFAISGDGRQLHLGVEADFHPNRKAHPCLVTDDLDGLAARLTTHGYAAVWDAAIEGVRRFYCEDCFGNRLEFADRVSNWQDQGNSEAT